MRAFGLSIVIGLSFVATVMTVVTLVDNVLGWAGVPNYILPSPYGSSRLWASIVALIGGAWLVERTWNRLHS